MTKNEYLTKKFSRLNDKQLEAVKNISGPLLILAGAGSGKTTVIVNRIYNIIKYGNAFNTPDFKLDNEASEEEVDKSISDNPCPPYRVLAITFTNKAANELKERLEAMIGEEATDIWASTFHSACVRILRRDIDKLGYEKSFTIYDYDDSISILKDIIKGMSLDDKRFPAKAVMTQISNAKDNLILPEDYHALNDFYKENIKKIYTEYQKRLKNADALDFDDIILNTVILLRDFKEVREYYQKRFSYIMVDEYQDTNHAQYMLVSLLAGGHHNLCVVGDDDQSIYKFRGATIENILSFEKTFSDAKVIRLEENYRSTKTVLGAANSVIEKNRERKGKTLWTNNPKGDKISLYKAIDEYSEAAFVEREILKLYGDKKPFKSNAVLYRMNAQSSVIERQFVKSGIPYRIVGGLRFYERKEIKDIIAYLTIICNQNDNLRLKRIINEPKRGIGETTVNNAIQIANGLGISLFEVFDTAEEYADLVRKAEAIKEFINALKEIIDKADFLKPSEILEEIFEKTGYRESLLKLGDEGLARVENVDELMSNIVKFETDNPDLTLSDFLEEVALLTDIDRLDEDADAVTLMTIHSAKGLEFDNVFLVGLEEGIFPSSLSAFDGAQIEEERRLLYVAITRARKKLFVSHTASRMLYGNTNTNRPSRFLSEIPREYTDANDETIISYSYTPKQAPKTYEQKPKVISIDYDVGDIVTHNVFGEGMVLSMTKMGNDILVEVAFSKVGTKKIMANFAKMKKV